jgi:hypothetical protein
MKSHIVLLCHLFCSQVLPLYAQDDFDFQPSQWRWNGQISGSISHVSFKNWTANNNEFSYVAGLSSRLYPKYSDNSWIFIGSWDGRFSMFGGNSQPLRKTEDRLELNLKFGRSLWSNSERSTSLYIILFNDLQTQFLPEYDRFADPHKPHYISNFLAPGYMTNGIGVDFRFDSLNLSIVVTPIAMKQTMVFDRGVDRTYYGLDTNQNIENVSGAYTRLIFSKEIFSKITLSMKSIFFVDYSEQFFIDVSFFGEIDYAITSYLKLYTSLHILSDDDLKVRLYEDLDADGLSDDFAGVGQHLQLYGQMGIMISINF